MPYTGTPLEVALAHSTGHLPPLGPHVPPEVAALVAALTAKDPAARPASAADTAAVGRRAARCPGRRGRPPGVAAPGDARGLPAWHLAWPGSGRPGVRAHRGAGRAAGGRLPAAAARTGVPRAGRALVVTAAVVTAGLAAWVLVGGAGPAPPVQQSRPAAPPSASPAAPRLAAVNQGALAGQPVDAVVQQLRQLGLHVQLAWQYSDQQDPGTVISVQPSGQLTPGTTVVVTGAVSPFHHHHGHGHGGN